MYKLILLAVVSSTPLFSSNIDIPDYEALAKSVSWQCIPLSRPTFDYNKENPEVNKIILEDLALIEILKETEEANNE
jgi:hypothetical protein